MNDAGSAPEGATDPPSAANKPSPMALEDSLTAWQAAGIIDAATAARIEAFEGTRRPVDRGSTGINVAEVVAYIGSIVLLVGVGFLYGTEYAALGTAGRLAVIGLVVLAGLAAGELVRLIGRTGAALRARSAGWSVAALAVAAWFAQAFVDGHILTRPAYPYPGAPDDTSGAIMLAAGIGCAIALGFLWRAGAGLVAFVTSVLAYLTAGAFDLYNQAAASAWENESSWLAAAAALAAASEVLTLGHDRRWAREVLRFSTVLGPTLAALVFSNMTGGDSLEGSAALLAVAAFGLALWRAGAGYAIAGGLALFAVVNEVGFRHFAQSVGFPIVLIVSGITLFLVAAGLFILLPRFRRSK